MVAIPTNQPGLSPIASTDIARPVAGRQLAGVAEAANWCEGWLFRPQLVISTDPDQGYYGAPAAARQHRLLWFSSRSTDYLWLAFCYRCREPLTGLAPSVYAHLWSQSGAANIDLGCNWTLANGDLKPEGDEQLPGAYKRRSGQIAHTGWLQNPQIDPAVMDAQPRMLRLTTFGGTDVELMIDTIQVDIYSIAIWEAWQPDLP